MKKSILIVFILGVISLHATNIYPIMKTCDSFLMKRQYLSAFKVLHRFDSLNNNKEILFKKQEIAMNFYLGQDKFQDFSFMDIQPYQVIENFRNKTYSGDVYHIPFHTLYEKFIKLTPQNDTLRKQLIEYYFQAYIEYGNEWVLPPKTIFMNIQREIMYLESNHKADAYHYYIMGYILMASEKTTDAIDFFNKSLDLDKKDGETNFNLGVAYDKLQQSDSALKYYKTAIIYYKDSAQKADAARNIGFIYEKMNDDLNAITYLQMSEKLQYANYYTLRSLLKLYAQTNNAKEKDFRIRFFMMAPGNKQIYIDLLAIYHHVNKLLDLEKYYMDNLPSYKQNYLVSGHLQFFLAELTKTKDKLRTKAYLDAALQNYKRVLPTNDEHLLFVEGIIKEYN